MSINCKSRLIVGMQIPASKYKEFEDLDQSDLDLPLYLYCIDSLGMFFIGENQYSIYNEREIDFFSMDYFEIKNAIKRVNKSLKKICKKLLIEFKPASLISLFDQI